MRFFLVASLAAVALASSQGCSSNAPSEDAASAWENLTAEDDDGAVVEDADSLPTDDLTTDLASDGVSIDEEDVAADDDAQAEPDALAAAAPDTVPGEGAEPSPFSGDLSAAAKTYQNSVLGNCADPGVVRVGGAAPTFFVA